MPHNEGFGDHVCVGNPMTKKLTRLYLRQVKTLARLQRTALGLMVPAPVRRRKPLSNGLAFPLSGLTAAKPPKPKPAPKGRAVSSGALPAKKPAAGASARGQAHREQAGGAGTWLTDTHDTPTTRSNLLGRLTYGLYLPAKRADTTGLPLVVMLHGCHQSNLDFARGTRMNRLADQQGVVVLYPQQATRMQSQRCWRWFRPTPHHGLAEADAIADLAQTVVAQYGLDASRVYVAGLSAGAGMAALVALRHPHHIAAVGMHSGAVAGDAQTVNAGLQTMRRGSTGDLAAQATRLLVGDAPFPGMPAFIVHGERDAAVAPRNATQLTQQFLALNQMDPDRMRPSRLLAQDTPNQYVRQDYLRGNKAWVRVCKVQSLGHAWSGGDSEVKYHAKLGPDASALMWRFFRMHRREQGRG